MIKIENDGVMIEGDTIGLIHDYAQITGAMVKFLEKHKILQALETLSLDSCGTLIDYLTSIIDAHKKFQAYYQAHCKE